MAKILGWLRAENPAGWREPEWKRSAAVADDGTVFVPAVIAGPEKAMLFKATWDGAPLLMDQEHLYLPASWMEANDPGNADIYRLIVKRAGEAFDL